MTMTREDAAAVLGIKTDELADVEDSPDGALLTTTDGCRYIVVPDDQPDANGNTGLMLFARPNETGDWPMAIYTPPGVVAAAEPIETEPTPDADPEPAAEPIETEPTPDADPEPAKGKGIRSKAD